MHVPAWKLLTRYPEGRFFQSGCANSTVYTILKNVAPIPIFVHFQCQFDYLNLLCQRHFSNALRHDDHRVDYAPRHSSLHLELVISNPPHLCPLDPGKSVQVVETLNTELCIPNLAILVNCLWSWQHNTNFWQPESNSKGSVCSKAFPVVHILCRWGVHVHTFRLTSQYLYWKRSLNLRAF